ncbi:MAG: helix-turn-helix transcriptional regulator [Pseudomonadota bacterium]
MTTNNYTKKQSLEDWHQADIVAALRKSGWSLRRLSTANGYAPTSVGVALCRIYPKAEQLIAKTLGVHPMVIWPSRYDKNGNPNRKKGPVPGSKNKPRVNK